VELFSELLLTEQLIIYFLALVIVLLAFLPTNSVERMSAVVFSSDDWRLDLNYWTPIYNPQNALGAAVLARTNRLVSVTLCF
jgi:hypothetical protein